MNLKKSANIFKMIVFFTTFFFLYTHESFALGRNYIPISASEVAKEETKTGTEPLNIDKIIIAEKELNNGKAKFCTGKRSLHKFCLEFYNGMPSQVAIGAIGSVIAIECVKRYLGSESTENNPFAAIALQSSLASSVTGILQGTFTAWQRCQMTPGEGLKELYKELMVNSADQVRTLPPDLAALITQLDKETEPLLAPRPINDLTPDLNTYNALNKQLTLRELVYLPFAWKPKDISNFSLSQEEVKIQQSAITELTEDYKEHADVLNSLILGIKTNSRLNNHHPKRTQAFIHGDPGTGKTTFAQRLAKTLGLYLCEISVKDLQIKDLMGDPFALLQSNQSSTIDVPKSIGRLGECFRRAGHSNFIVLLDEIGDLISGDDTHEGYPVSDQRQELKAQLKVLTDPNTKQIALGIPGLNADFTRVIIIGTGNDAIKNRALIERFQQIKFEKLNRAQKEKAYNDGYKKSLSRIEHEETTPDYEQNLKKIQEFTAQYRNFILEEDEKKFTGGRVIKDVIDEFVLHIQSLVMKNKEPTDSNSREFIQKAFERRCYK